MRYIAALTLLLLASGLCAAEEIRIVLWNSERMFDVDTVQRRAADLREFADSYPDADIIVLDEVTSLEVVAAIRDRLGLTGYHVACSDFAQDDHDTFNSLEVGIISRFPLTDVLEYDPSPDNTQAVGEPAERPLVNIGLPGLADAMPSRGYLVARVPHLGLTVLATHLKSARGQTGQADLENAQQREFVAASMARFVSSTLREDPAATVLVAGDMNVGETDRAKVGYRLEEDCFEPGAGDLYDDTGAIFSAGLVDGLHMASLTAALGQETFDSVGFAGAGPIDRMYVAGGQASDFTLAAQALRHSAPTTSLSPRACCSAAPCRSARRGRSCHLSPRACCTSPPCCPTPLDRTKGRNGCSWAMPAAKRSA